MSGKSLFYAFAKAYILPYNNSEHFYKQKNSHLQTPSFGICKCEFLIIHNVLLLKIPHAFLVLFLIYFLTLWSNIYYPF